MYSKVQLIVFIISNIALVIWLLYGFVKLNRFLKDTLGINEMFNK